MAPNIRNRSLSSAKLKGVKTRVAPVKATRSTLGKASVKKPKKPKI